MYFLRFSANSNKINISKNKRINPKLKYIEFIISYYINYFYKIL